MDDIVVDEDDADDDDDDDDDVEEEDVDGDVGDDAGGAIPSASLCGIMPVEARDRNRFAMAEKVGLLSELPPLALEELDEDEE